MFLGWSRAGLEVLLVWSRGGSWVVLRWSWSNSKVVQDWFRSSPIVVLNQVVPSSNMLPNFDCIPNFMKILVIVLGLFKNLLNIDIHAGFEAHMELSGWDDLKTLPWFRF